MTKKKQKRSALKKEIHRLLERKIREKSVRFVYLNNKHFKVI